MNLLLTITDEDVLTEPVAHKVSEFYKRRAARAVVFDETGAVYLMHVTKQGYHKLPGGGVKEDEDTETALQRELLEEVGCTAEIVGEVGEVKEYRHFQKLDHSSYCYIARQVGTKQESALEEDELADGMQDIRVKNIDEAIRLLQSDVPKNDAGKFIQRRDLCFLIAAKKLYEQGQVVFNKQKA